MIYSFPGLTLSKLLGCRQEIHLWIQKIREEEESPFFLWHLFTLRSYYKICIKQSAVCLVDSNIQWHEKVFAPFPIDRDAVAETEISSFTKRTNLLELNHFYNDEG